MLLHADPLQKWYLVTARAGTPLDRAALRVTCLLHHGVLELGYSSEVVEVSSGRAGAFVRHLGGNSYGEPAAPQLIPQSCFPGCS